MDKQKAVKRNDEYERNEDNENTNDSKTQGDMLEGTSSYKKDIIKQIQQEYKICYDSQVSKIQEGLRRLKLYNNQARDKKRVGDPLLFTVFNTVFSSLYKDRFSVTFEGISQGDEQKAENISNLAEHDYIKMQKKQIDYDWGWNTCFYGRGLVLLEDFDFDEEMLCPIAEAIDPMTFLRDPNATSVNGDMYGNGAMRFGGREIGLTKWQMRDRGYNCDGLLKDKEVDELLRQARQERASANNTQQIDFSQETLNENYEYTLLEWYTHIDGEKWCITIANGKNKIVRAIKLKQQKRWGIIDKTIYPMAQDWDGVSIPDLIEDKQRARAIMINLGLDSAKSDLHPMYFYNKKKITNKKDLDFGFNKGVGVNGSVDGAYTPMVKAQGITQQVNLILGILENSGEKALAASELAQGITPSQDRTATENELVAAGRGSRMSLSAALWGASEERFWRQWYFLYKVNFDSEKVGEKIIRINGALSKKYKSLKTEDIITELDPDVVVISKAEKQAVEDRERAMIMPFSELALQDPTVNRRFILRKLARLSGVTEEEQFFMLPPNVHELKAEDENSMLESGTYVPVDQSDDDIQHIEIHMRAEQTKQVMAHILAHKKMLYFKQSNEMLQQDNQKLDSVSKVSNTQEPQESVTQQRAKLMEANQ